jgi:hypothetical protein
MSTLDWIVIVGYFVAVFGVALWAYRQEQEDDTASGYFLGGRNVGWFVVGARARCSSTACSASASRSLPGVVGQRVLQRQLGGGLARPPRPAPAVAGPWLPQPAQPGEHVAHDARDVSGARR